MDETDHQSEKPGVLASARVRRCSNCGHASMLHVSGKDGWTSLSERSGMVVYRCAHCGHGIELYDHTALILVVLIGLAALAALFFLNDHPLWFLVYTLAHPVEAFTSLLKDGPFVPFAAVLVFAMLVFLLLLLPLMALGYGIQTIVARCRNRVVPGDQAELPAGAVAAVAAVPARQRFSLKQIPAALAVALGLHLGLIAFVVLVNLWGGGREVIEGLLENAIPAVLLSGGVLLGTQRWLVALLWALLLPFSGFAIFLIQSM